MENQKLGFFQKVGIFWIKQVDSSLIMTKSLQTIPKPLRLLFYAGLVAFTTFGMIFISHFINIDDDMPFAQIIRFLGKVVFYGVILGSILVLSLEGVIKLDIAQIFKQIKQQKEDIKRNKLQGWRLRNMPFIARVFVYILVYILLLLIIQTSVYTAFNDLFPIVPNTPEGKQLSEIFISEYDKFVQWFSFIYFTSSLILDYFVNRKRVKNEIL